MTNIESRFERDFPGSGRSRPPRGDGGCAAGVLNPAQQETVQTLRAALVALTEQPG